MKATGIVRRIDDLGRVVIPKEIRRTLRIREGEPLEIFTERDGSVVFKKYSQVGELSTFAGSYADAIYKVSGYPAAIIDKDTVVAASGIPKKEVVDKTISPKIEEFLSDRMTYGYNEEDGEPVSLIEGSDKYLVNIMCPVVIHGDAAGGVVIFSEDSARNLSETEEKIAQTSATVLGKILED